MLLVTLTINGDDHLISNEFCTLTHYWDAKIVSMSSVRYATSKEYGGFVKPQFGTISFLPELFQGADWPPPKSCTIKVEFTDTTEAAAVTLFSGTIHREEIRRDQIDYGFFGLDDSETAVVAFTGNLDTEFDSECTSLSLTLDSTGSTRDAALDTGYSPTGKRDRLEAMSDVAAFFAHYFWIEGTTLYLADMLLSNGATLALTEFEVFPSSYDDPPPYSLIKSGDDSIDGSYAYGKEYSVSPTCHGATGDVEDALGDIMTIIEMSQIVIRCPLEVGNIPNIGQKITLTDESLQESVDIEMWARAIVYDFDNDVLVIEGEGTIT